MAEDIAFRNNIYDFPVFDSPWVQQFPIRNSAGALVIGATSLDSEISKNGDTPVDCVNEAVHIGGGMYYLIVAATETNCNGASILVKCAEADPVPIILQPTKYNDLLYGDTGITGVDAGEFVLPLGTPLGDPSPFDDAYNGGFIAISVDGVQQSRLIYDYNGATRTVYLWDELTGTPDADDPWAIRIPIGMVTQTASTPEAIVDALLRRDWTKVATPADRSMLQAMRLLRNHWDIVTGVLTVTKEDDTTTAWTSAMTGTPGALPVTGSNPV